MCRSRCSFKGEKVICQKAPLIHFWPLRPGHVGDDDDVFADDESDFGDVDDDDCKGDDDDDLCLYQRSVSVYFDDNANIDEQSI